MNWHPVPRTDCDRFTVQSKCGHWCQVHFLGQRLSWGWIPYFFSYCQPQDWALNQRNDRKEQVFECSGRHLLKDSACLTFNDLTVDLDYGLNLISLFMWSAHSQVNRSFLFHRYGHSRQFLLWVPLLNYVAPIVKKRRSGPFLWSCTGR